MLLLRGVARTSGVLFSFEPRLDDVEAKGELAVLPEIGPKSIIDKGDLVSIWLALLKGELEVLDIGNPEFAVGRGLST